MNNNDYFESEYAKVQYIETDNIVFLTWKKYCCFDDYRTPTTFALDLLTKHANSNFIVDARNGFEDTVEDVEWGFHHLIPKMAETDCKFVVFIMEHASEIEEEMDLWTREFGKYFCVIRTTSYQNAVNCIHNVRVMRVTYTIKDGLRDDFLIETNKLHIIQKSRQEPSNISYDMYMSVDDENDVHLIEVWPSEKAFQVHLKSSHYQQLQTLKDKYVLKTCIEKYALNTVLSNIL